MLAVGHTESTWQSLADMERHSLADSEADIQGVALAQGESMFLADKPGVRLPVFLTLKHAVTLG